MAKAKPTKMAPEETAASTDGSNIGQSRPQELSAEDVAMSMMADQGPTAPSLIPPEGERGVTGVTAWQNDKRVATLWAINENRNSWVYITNVGWKKLANASDSGIVAMTILASHAKELQRRIDYRDEADGMIHEMYIW